MFPFYAACRALRKLSRIADALNESLGKRGDLRVDYLEGTQQGRRGETHQAGLNKHCRPHLR